MVCPACLFNKSPFFFSKANRHLQCLHESKKYCIVTITQAKNVLLKINAKNTCLKSEKKKYLKRYTNLAHSSQKEVHAKPLILSILCTHAHSYRTFTFFSLFFWQSNLFLRLKRLVKMRHLCRFLNQ